MQNKINILCTRPLGASLLNEALAKGISIEEISFIETNALHTLPIINEIKDISKQLTTVAFTSMNAVEAVADIIKEQPINWSIYCIGTTTHQLVKKHFGAKNIAGNANSAAELALLIAEDKSIKKVDFFCGDQRRDELPDILRNNKIEVNEVVIYKTSTIAHTISKTYNGILFFSPSGVHSFFENNTLPADTILFAIGSTTGNEILKFSNNQIVLSDEPGKENLVRKMIAYFTEAST